MSQKSYDLVKVQSLREEALDFRHKAVPAALHGLSAGEFATKALPLGGLQTPLLTLDADALDLNARRLAGWCAEHGVLLAPHGKTTMSPELWARQMDLGAWGITLANAAQLRVARAFGFTRLMLANSLTDPQAIRWAADQAAGGARIVSWVDKLETVALLESELSGHGVLEVIVERGGTGGRTGARSHEEAMAIARAVHASPALRLTGAGGYEGALAHTWDDAGLAAVRGYLADVARLHAELLAEGLYDTEQIMVTAGGSAYFDDVVDVLAPLRTEAGDGTPAVDVVIRSGAYIIHDDGFYRGISPFSRRDPDGPEAFRSAMHAWVRVVSQPEPGLAILEGGKRDLPFDEGLPVPQLIGDALGGPAAPLEGAEITAVNDQHAFLRFPEGLDVKPGQVIRLGLSHPCTALDKWTLIPVLDTSSEPERSTVVGAVRTFF
ncbi:MULTISPECIES: amino acid deaminase [Arthrobacter]|uniref:Amino acid deaminase n=2 Tax=Arthrobacter TaxID=1663 RepID=A0ABU9KFX5_9MICC|nr:amino acid deaminase [Arthrobacter sp. YJM1]MDP5225789.1 amino acid deaminase [Arthrobacter sp. YJM1]